MVRGGGGPLYEEVGPDTTSQALEGKEGVLSQARQMVTPPDMVVVSVYLSKPRGSIGDKLRVLVVWGQLNLFFVHTSLTVIIN